MEIFDVYKDITERTNGDIYVGVVGPVRAGKSTFITSFVDKLIMPKITSPHAKERMQDELPQSADGKTIMTTQPKFVPSEAVAITLGDGIDIKVRLVDCVGYLIDGASGHMDGEKPRMVKTPWSEKEMEFSAAADYGTKKVIRDHASIGIVMTTDGSIATDIPRSSYVEAEERIVSELKELGKPFVVVLNSKVPDSSETLKLAAALEEKYDTAVIPIDAINMTEEQIGEIFEKLLYEFPLRTIDVDTDKWLQALEFESGTIEFASKTLLLASENMRKMSDYKILIDAFGESEEFTCLELSSICLGSGSITYKLIPKEDLFYKVLSAECGVEITDDFMLMRSLKSYATAKKEYDKLSDALNDARESGYGIVTPTVEDMTLHEPQVVRQGSAYGVRLKATAPSLHIMQVDISTEVNPVMGTAEQSEQVANYLLSEFEVDPNNVWQTNMFGRSISDMVGENLRMKNTAMPVETQKKMRKTLSRIVNEGKGGVICILL